jgi:hypothetical protein
MVPSVAPGTQTVTMRDPKQKRSAQMRYFRQALRRSDAQRLGVLAVHLPGEHHLIGLVDRVCVDLGDRVFRMSSVEGTGLLQPRQRQGDPIRAARLFTLSSPRSARSCSAIRQAGWTSCRADHALAGNAGRSILHGQRESCQRAGCPQDDVGDQFGGVVHGHVPAAGEPDQTPVGRR